MAAHVVEQDGISSSDSSARKSSPSGAPLPTDEREIFREALFPDDSYTSDGVYWADLPFSERVKFVNAVDRAEVKKEWNSMRAMMKQSIFSPVKWYFKNAVLPGAGLGLEGYVHYYLMCREGVLICEKLCSLLDWQSYSTVLRCMAYMLGFS
jgi:hypothetical protein